MKKLPEFWYKRHYFRWLLSPAAFVYRAVVRIRRQLLQRFCQHVFPVPVIVVGNLTVGGVGKTPLVIELAHQFKSRGLRVGIVSRGYGALVKQFPHEVHVDELAKLVGDEPLLLARKTGCPVVIAPKRVQAVQYLLDKHQSQVVISDDGLQHYAMGRSIEIVVIDGSRGFGNGFCLPAGPLREPVKRLKQVDFVVVNGGVLSDVSYTDRLTLLTNKITHRMDLLPGKPIQLTTGQPVQWDQLSYPIAAVAAIGNPQRFFETLRALGLYFNAYSFADHHQFQPAELCVEESVVVMTEKDAVKCYPFATDKMYFLPVTAHVCDHFWTALWSHKQFGVDHGPGIFS